MVGLSPEAARFFKALLVLVLYALAMTLFVSPFSCFVVCSLEIWIGRRSLVWLASISGTGLFFTIPLPPSPIHIAVITLSGQSGLTRLARGDNAVAHVNPGLSSQRRCGMSSPLLSTLALHAVFVRTCVFHSSRRGYSHGRLSLGSFHFWKGAIRRCVVWTCYRRRCH
jgi:hypothetical protein